MSGLGKMDFYHVFLLFVFVWAALYPEAFEKNVIWLLVYADAFVLAKYLYTLITQIQYPPLDSTSPQPKPWLTIIGISSVYNPQGCKQYFRYAPRVDQWLLVFLAFVQYRRTKLVGTDLKEISKNEDSILASLTIKFPFSSKVTKFLGIMINHGIVILAFLSYLLTLTFMRRSILNLISLVLLLCLLASYLTGGIKVLLKQWKIIGLYQAFVLLSILAFQFTCQSPGLADYQFYKNFSSRLGPYGSGMVYWTGYYKFAQPIWYYFLPYVLMFFFAIILTQQFKNKDERESKDLASQVSLTNGAPSGELQLVEDQQFDPRDPINASLYSARPNQADPLQLNVVQRSDPTPEQIKDNFYSMQYKLSYLLWKLELLWPVFDAISLYFNLILSTVILVFAVYFQLAIVWFVYLLIFLIQTWRLYRNHYQYKIDQYERFINLQQGNVDQMKTYSALQARKSKLALNDDPAADKIVNKIIKNEGQKINNDLVTQERLLITDEQAIEEYQRYKSTVHLVTLSSRGYFWATQYIVLTVAFTLLYLGAFIPTSFTYPPNASPSTPTQQVHPIQDQQKSNTILFLLFAAGLFSDISNPQNASSLDDRRELMADYYPFFILLFLLISEKLCQLWLKDRFKTSDEIIQVFCKIEANFKALKEKLSLQEKQDKLDQQRLIIRRRSSSRLIESETEQIQTDPSLASEHPEEEVKQPIIEGLHPDNTTSINTNYLSAQSQQQILFQDGINDQRKSSKSNRASFQVVDDENEDGYTARFSYNPNSTTAVQTKRELMQQIKPRLQIKSQVKFDMAMRALFVEILIMLVWFSCIYKQSILSFILFFALVFHTYSKNSNTTFNVIGLTVFSVFVIEYSMALLSLSSYNSPQPFPTQLTSNGVYPNSNNTYFAIPVYFNLTSNISAAGVPTINVQFWSFFNFYVNGQRLNGIWIDFAVIAMAFLYLNLYNLWILQEPIKLIPSNYTNHLIKEYYDTKIVKGQSRNTDLLRREMSAEISQNRVIKSLSSMVYTNFSLLLIMFILFISIFAKSLLSLGYFIFSMLLIYNNRSFFKDTGSSASQTYILKYWLMPYLLLDILLQLILEIPLNNSGTRLVDNAFLGLAFKEVWIETPTTVTFGQNVTVITTLESSMVALFLKGMLYFMISLQILIVQSMGFKRFSDQVLLDNVKNANHIGTGIAYRFNNFKNKRVIASAKDYGLLEKMLTHVKKLIKRRETRYKQMEQPPVKKKQLIKNDEIIEEDEKSEDESLARVEQDVQTQMKDFKQQFKTEVDIEYKRRIQELGWADQFYLWLRRNYVQDILFKHSDDHLIDTVEQFRMGRTSIRTQLEIGILMQTKLDWLKTKLTELQKKAEVGEQTKDEELLEEFQTFRREQIAQMEPKPWERLNLRTFRTTKKLIQNYLVMFYKILASYTHLFCYFFMLLALFSNGGLLYLVYPFIIFGIAMMEERRPGRIFWYFVIIYTQIIIIIQFLAQLNIWKPSDGATTGSSGWWNVGQNIFDFSNKYNLGLKYLTTESFASVLKQFYPEILILIFVLLHIQQETLAGLFDVSLEKYESFEEGLERYIQIVLAQDTKALKIYESEQLIKKVREGFEFDAAFVLKRRNSAPDQLYCDQEAWAEDPQWLYDVDLELVKYPLEKQRLYRRAISLINKADLEDFAEHVKENTKRSAWEKTRNFLQANTKVLWDNEFFDRLFPIIKQQKPGIDLYVYIALVEIVLCFYIIIFFTLLTKQNNSTIAQQIQTNQLQGPMVVALFVMIGIAVVDRIFYTTFAFMNRVTVNKKLNIDSPLLPADTSMVVVEPGRSESLNQDDFIRQQQNRARGDTYQVLSQGSPQNSQRDSRNSSFQPPYDINRSRQNTQYSNNRPVAESFQNRDRKDSVQSNSQLLGDSNPLDVTFAVDQELSAKEQHAYYQSLLPQYNEKGILKVCKFYWYWFVLIIVHYYIFLHLSKQVGVCPISEPRCNLLNTNTSLTIFYVIFCIYFMLGAYQIQVGLPELKKGGFMQGRFNSVSKITYEIWYYIPFLFELRTIIDWTFTQTALDVFQSIKLAQAQSDLYIAKCYNKPYMAKELGSEIKWYLKILIGVSLTLFILLLIGGPILLFSTFNPVSTINNVKSASLQVVIQITNGTKSTQTIPLFETRQVTTLSTLTQDQFDILGFGLASSTMTNQFKPDQVQIVQFGQFSDTVWLISPPNLQQLNIALLAANFTPPAGNLTESNSQVVQIMLTADFIRTAPQASQGQYQKPFQLDSSTSSTIDSLISALNCANPLPNQNPVTLNQTDINIAIELTSTQVSATPLSPVVPAGVNLTYFCDATQNSTNYWSLAPVFANQYSQQGQQLNKTNPFFQPEQEYISTASGFGFFVFSQTGLPSYLASYASSVLFFYGAVVYVIASAFRSAFVPVTSQIFITDAVLTEDILMVCQCVYIYRVQRNHKNEEELYMILIDILRSPEMIKAISGPSLKKELD